MTTPYPKKRCHQVRDIGVGIVLLVVAQYLVIGTAAFLVTRDLVIYADEFFSAVAENDLDRAYDYLSKDFQSSTAQSELSSYLKQFSVTDIQTTDWKTRSKENGNQGTIEGGITTETGNVVPIRVTFVKNNRVWKIDSIEQFEPIPSGQ